MLVVKLHIGNRVASADIKYDGGLVLFQGMTPMSDLFNYCNKVYGPKMWRAVKLTETQYHLQLIER